MTSSESMKSYLRMLRRRNKEIEDKKARTVTPSLASTELDVIPVDHIVEV